MKIRVNNLQELICAGFYSEMGTFSIKGTYFIKVDITSEQMVSKSIKEFGVDFLTQNMTERQENKTKKKIRKEKNVELYQYDLDEIIIDDKGGAFLIGEQYFVRKTTTMISDGNGGTTMITNFHYYYNDIIVVRMSPEGQIDWAQKIPKRQSTTNDGGYFSSYVSAVVEDKIYFVFNDNSKNLVQQREGKPYRFNKGKESITVLVQMDLEGNQSKLGLFGSLDSKTLTRPKVCEQVSENELILFGVWKKKNQFATVNFK